MEKSNLEPIVRNDLDILFIGLNPGKKSSDNGHYFSAKQRFWDQLFDAGLITKSVDKDEADDIVFKNNKFNYHRWSYGVTDLVPEIAESNGGKVKPTKADCKVLESEIKKYEPKIAILLHWKVKELLLSYLGAPPVETNSGQIGQIIKNCPTTFYSIGFPHGSNISDEEKVEKYEEVKSYLLEN